MNRIKKALAIVLALCMLIGMPLSLDVSATGRPDASNYTMPFRLVQATPVPESWNTGLPADRAVALYFSGDVTIDTDKTKAYITLVNEIGLAAYVDPVNGKRNQGQIISVWDATIVRCEALGSVNNYVAILEVPQPRNRHELVDTISEILDLAAKTKLTPVVRLRETEDKVEVDGSTSQRINHTLNSIYEGTTRLASTLNGVDDGGCNKNGQVIQNVTADASEEEKASSRLTNCYDYVDITITALPQTPTILYAEYDPNVTSGNNFRVILNSRLGYSHRGAHHTPTHLRVVNSKGQIIYTNGSTYLTESQAVTATGITSGYYALGNYNNSSTDRTGLNSEVLFASGSLFSCSLSSMPRAAWDGDGSPRDWTATYNTCVAARDLLNARNDGETYSVALVVDENDGSADYKDDHVYATNGESPNNWRVDGLWSMDTNAPMVATHNNAALGISDRVIVPVYTVDETSEKATQSPSVFYLKDVTFVSNAGKNDHIVMEFSKPISNFTYSYAGLRVYAPNYVPYVDGTPVQWQIHSVTRLDSSGTRWVGMMGTTFGCDSLSEAKDWLVKAGYATNTNGVFAMTGNRRLEFSIADNAADPRNNRSIDQMVADDGSLLFANDSPFGASEERATISASKFHTSTGVHIENVTLYADKYVLIDFNQNITFDQSTIYKGLSIYDSQLGDLAGCNASETKYGLYNTDFDGNNGAGNQIFQRSAKLRYYGNRKDILLAEITPEDYQWLMNHYEKANAWSVANGGSASRFRIALRLQDIPSALAYNVPYAIQAFSSTENPYSYLSAGGSDWSTVYAFPATAGKRISELTCATIFSDNQAVVSFTSAIRSAEPSAFTLISGDGSKTYTATAAQANGNDVILTFDNPVYTENMTLRISGGSNYLIDTQIITTEDGTAILTNESETSALLHPEFSEAVAAARVNDTNYLFFKTAWSLLKAGDTLTMLDDAALSSSMNVLSANVTLDLNGRTLHVNNLISFGNIVDSSNGEGLLKADTSDRACFVILHEENTAMPLYDTDLGGYRFFVYNLVNRGMQAETTNNTVTALKYGVNLHFTNEDAYRLLLNSENTDVNLDFALTVRMPDRPVVTMVYTVPNSILVQFANGVLDDTANVIVIRATGITDVAQKVSSLSAGAILDARYSLTSGAGVTRDSSQSVYHVGITAAQAAFNWIDEHINNHNLVSFTHKHSNGEDMSNLGNRSYWTAPTITTTGTYDAQHDWTRKVVYTNKLRGTLTFTLDISFDAEHAAIDYVGSWSYSGIFYSFPISNIRILDAEFDINEATMTTARQGGQNYVYDYQPYSVDLTETNTYTMKNTGGRSTQGGWPYFDLTNAQNTHGIMGAIGWSGNWVCDFTYVNENTVRVSAGMQNTNYQMISGETLRTPSMVIQFFDGTQEDGHNNWRQLVLDNYTPNDINGDPVRYAPITINTWGGAGTDSLLNTMKKIHDSGQYFEYQWIDAGWYGNAMSSNTYDGAWSRNVGNWYYNPGYTTTDEARTKGGFDELYAWHEENGTGLLVWFEPGRATAESVMGTAASASKPHKFTATYMKPQADGSLKQVTETVSWNHGYFLKNTSNVDYGDANALKYITAVVLHYLDDMGCYFYRQDYNFNPAGGWTTEDAAASDGTLEPDYRVGVSEIKYMTGHYQLLDTIIATGRQIDNCASGGRLLDIEMTKRSIPLWRTDYTVSGQDVTTIASGVRSQGANLSWWLPISGGMGSSEGVASEYTFRSFMASGATMGRFGNQEFATKMIDEMLYNRELMLGDYYILQQGLHEGLYHSGSWLEEDASLDYTDTTDAAYEFYREDMGKGYLVTFRPNLSTKTSQTYKLRGLDANATYLVEDADSGEAAVYSGRYLMEHGIKVVSETPRTSHMIYFTKQ